MFERDLKLRTSPALWIAVAWMILAGSRPVSMWLQINPDPSLDQNLDGNPLDRLVFSGLLALAIGVLVSRRQRVSALLAANGPLLLFVAYCAISTMWSDYPGVAFKRWIKALGDPVMVLIVLSDPNCRAAIKKFFAWTGFFFMPVSVLLVKYYPRLGLHFSTSDGGQGFVGVATDKNMLGAICLFSGIGAIWRFLNARSDRRLSRSYRPLIAQGAILLMAVWLLWSANSMTSIACLTLGGTLMLLTTIPFIAKRRAIVHMFALGGVTAACVPLFLDAAGGMLNAVGRDPTLTQRTELWGEVLRLTTNPIVGAGFESFWLGSRLKILWAHFWWRPNESHNGYLEVFLNLGWVGVVLLALIIASGYRNAFRALRQDVEVGKVKLAGVIAGVVYGFTEAGFRMMHPMWVSTILAVAALDEGALPATSTTTEAPAEDPTWTVGLREPKYKFKMPQRPAAGSPGLGAKGLASKQHESPWPQR